MRKQRKQLYGTKIQFALKPEVKQFLEEEARKERRDLSDYLRLVLDDFKAQKQTQQECSTS